jgi:tRNA (mo5U34)-methyltransferase
MDTLTTDLDDLRRQVAAIPWHHRIDLGHGITTPGLDRTADKLERLKLPQSLAGKTVLDVGAWDGFFSFEAERRGAARVLATDSHAWNGNTPRLDKSGFNLARRVLGSRVEDQHIDIMDLGPQRVGGQWDVVLFLGVLYHLKHPLLALERVASVTRELAIIETVVDLLWTRRPALAFYPGAELGDDASNWFGPNPRALEGMLRTAGFRRVETVAAPRWFGFRLARAVTNKLRRGHRFWPGLLSDRIVMHAWK